MKDIKFASCAEWIEKLAAMHPDDLSTSELAALSEHILSCSACATVRHEYQIMLNALSQDQSMYEPPVVLPPKLLELWKMEDHLKESSSLNGTYLSQMEHQARQVDSGRGSRQITGKRELNNENDEEEFSFYIVIDKSHRKEVS